MNARVEKSLLEKLRMLPPAQLAEVEDFVDFLRSRNVDLDLTHSATRGSETAFKAVWENPDDADYDHL